MFERVVRVVHVRVILLLPCSPTFEVTGKRLLILSFTETLVKFKVSRPEHVATQETVVSFYVELCTVIPSIF